ncbi:MAG: response regulator [Ignavibacteriales bacterium]|jgi:CheY-like chemotaxis protein|nr:response regulator [Ignavibacteriales bacterium]
MLGKILIVEDDLFLQDFYRLFFKKIGGEILILEDGKKIIDEISNGKINLIIMDINLRNTYLNDQKIDGIKLSRYIKINFPNFSIPILLVTAYSQLSMRDEFLKDSLADDILVKPIVDYNQLIEKINKLVFA